jgi:hypothetical protein
MRFVPLAIVTLATTSVAAALLLVPDGTLPPIGPSVEPICLEAMRHAKADLVWNAPDRDDRARGRTPTSVRLSELRFHSGELVRVEGLLHAEFEWVALYPSRAALEGRWRLEDRWPAPWIALESLWPNEAERWWRTRGPSISDRCVRVEGWYEGGAAGHFGVFDGTVDVLRLEVWSEPHRPFDMTPPPPPPRR